MKRDNLLKAQILVVFFIFISCGLTQIFFSQPVIMLYSQNLKAEQLNVFAFSFLSVGWGIIFGSVMSFYCSYYQYKKEINVWLFSILTSSFLFILGLGEVFFIPRSPFSWILCVLSFILVVDDVFIKKLSKRKQINPKSKKQKI
jgi:hypothetical protein